VPRVISCPSRGGTFSPHYELQLTPCLHSNHRAVEERSIAGFAIWGKRKARRPLRGFKRGTVIGDGACPWARVPPVALALRVLPLHSHRVCELDAPLPSGAANCNHSARCPGSTCPVSAKRLVDKGVLAVLAHGR
jgi:hypothetical protein